MTGGSVRRVLLILALLGSALLDIGWQPRMARAATIQESAGRPLGAQTPPTPEAPSVPAPSAAGRHVVQEGDTLFSIAARHNLNVDALVWANELSDSNVIRVGQSLVIPT